jgi:hypothetical protein
LTAEAQTAHSIATPSGLSSPNSFSELSIMRPALVLASLVGAASALSGCQLEPQRQIAVAPPTAVIEGQWNSVGGPVAYISSFSAGRFTSKTADGARVLADGSYTKTSPTQVAIIFTSTTRNTRESVNCNLMSAERLACVNSAGARFELARRAGV